MYKEDDKLRQLVKRSKALPIVPLVEEVDTIAESSQGEKVVKYMDHC